MDLHHRRSSKGEDENIVLVARPMEAKVEPVVSAPPPPRNRVVSSPTSDQQRGHARTRSISAFAPSVHSPLASSFPAPVDSRRHARIHSRNLSVFFPRPASLPTASIAEDGAQELEIPVSLVPSDGAQELEIPVSLVPSAIPVSIPAHRSRRSARGGSAPPAPLGVGFTFGGRPPSSAAPTPTSDLSPPTPLTSSRRGHHHKHSMSHSFFSFLEPGSTTTTPEHPHLEQLHTQPTPMPLSPWAPISAFPLSARSTSPGSGFPPHTPISANGHSFPPTPDDKEEEDWDTPPSAVLFGLAQFVLGAWLWVSGQQIGSLSVTGLGYWVVFDAFGVGLWGAVRRWWPDRDLRAGETETPMDRERRVVRRPFGIAPVKTVLMFGQAVYLLFSSVYVCKETLEHLLLSAGNVDGHHHHHGDEDEGIIGIEFPVLLACITFVSLICTSLFYKNNSRLVSVTRTRLPPLHTLLLLRQSKSQPQPQTRTADILSNPYILSPLTSTTSIILIALFVPTSHHRPSDLVLAGLITVSTFILAYRACTVLGTVLLQTAPPRGGRGGRIERFWRVMREIERHPHVMHLPAPHIWELAPLAPSSSGKPTEDADADADEALVVTMELHVRRDVGDGDVIELTRWAWERFVGALGAGVGAGAGRGRGVEVTVGVVRG
ncbi:hypothetical protein C0995_012763 [Termitomyces sp. Mi166|nr:hypothetical protein C0995_012763 [Termitomyces sp. Mi166\